MDFLERLLPKLQDYYQYVIALVIIAVWWVYSTIRRIVQAHKARENRQRWTNDNTFDAPADTPKTPRRRIPLS